LGAAFEKILAGMISKLITYYLMMELVGLITSAFPGTANALKGAGAGGPFGGGAGLGSGGSGGGGGSPIQGPSFGGFDAVSSFGSAVSPMAMASSGASAATPAGSLVQVSITNGSGQAASTDQSQGADGKQLLDIFIGQAANDIRTGGKLAQQIQQTFSIGRTGVTRG
jgi:hypothetical protein